MIDCQNRSRLRPAPRIYEYVFVEAYNKVYAFVETDSRSWDGPREHSKLTINGRLYKTSGIVSRSDQDWVVALFYRDQGKTVHDARKHPLYLDGRSSLKNLSYLMFMHKDLIEMSEVKA